MNSSASHLEIGPLMGGGLVLGYRCTSRCAHCLYGCGPHRRDGLAENETGEDRVLDLLATQAPQARLHIGGGEPFLDPGRLQRVLTGLAARGLDVDYVETNASWVEDLAQAEDMLGRMKAAGLGCVLVSLSPFHAQHVPLARTLTLIEAAQRVLTRGAFVWVPEFLRELQEYPQDRRIDLEQHVEAMGGDDYAQGLAGRYFLVPAGRAGRFLHRHGASKPWHQLLAGGGCSRRLADTSHFHVDLAGHYVPGLCPGMVLELEDVPGSVDLSAHPVLEALVTGGPGRLFQMADKQGFEPMDTYGSACDFCTHMRTFLHGRGEYPELGPEGFYDERSVSFGELAGAS